MASHPPEAMARVEVYLNTTRMRRRVTDLFAARGARVVANVVLPGQPSRQARFALD